MQAIIPSADTIPAAWGWFQFLLLLTFPLHLLAMNAMLLVVGMFMDIISATMILGPVFLPMLDAFGISWMHFGLIMTVNLAIGYCTPPMGVSLYITGAIANKNLIYVTKAVIPFLIIQMAVLMLICVGGVAR